MSEENAAVEAVEETKVEETAAETTENTEDVSYHAVEKRRNYSDLGNAGSQTRPHHRTAFK